MYIWTDQKGAGGVVEKRGDIVKKDQVAYKTDQQ